MRLRGRGYEGRGPGLDGEGREGWGKALIVQEIVFMVIHRFLGGVWARTVLIAPVCVTLGNVGP